MNIFIRLTLAMFSFSAVMLLCSMCAMLGMALNLDPPPEKIWLGSWLGAATIVAIVVAMS